MATTATDPKDFLAKRRDIERLAKQRGAEDRPTNPKVLALWRDWFDKEKTSIRDVIETFQVDTDAGVAGAPVEDEEEGEDGVEFKTIELRLRQAEILDAIENDFWGRLRRAAFFRILKSRRYGMTTFAILLGLERILRVPGYAVLLVAQDDVMARLHFQRLRGFLQQVPKWALAEADISIVKDTDQLVILRHGRFKTSEFRVAPAKRNALGRGGRVNMLIMTEGPHWPKAAKREKGPLLRSIKNRRGNIILDESTAKGFDEFRADWYAAKEGRSDYRAVFIASYEHPDNRRPFETPEAEAAFEATLGHAKYGGEEETILFRRLVVDLRWAPRAALEYLHWRRFEIENQYSGHVQVFHREEPNTPEEAFEGTGFPVLDRARLNAWLMHAEAREKAARRGTIRLTETGAEFTEDRLGLWTVFEDPVRGTGYYVSGDDVASGIARRSDGREADWSVVVMKEVYTGRTVARFRGHVRPGVFAQRIFEGCVWFNGARTLPERNNDGGTTIDRFEDLENAGVSGAELLLSQRVLVKTDSANRSFRWEPGYRTTRTSKEALVDRINDFLAEIGVPNGVTVCPMDFLTIQEALKFERDPTTNRVEAMEGFDDCVIAEALALEGRQMMLSGAMVPEKTPIPKKPDLTQGPRMRYTLKDAPTEERRSDPVLGAQFKTPEVDKWKRRRSESRRSAS